MHRTETHWALLMGTLAITTLTSVQRLGAEEPAGDRLHGITLRATVSITHPASQMVDVQLQYAGLPQERTRLPSRCRNGIRS